MSSNGNRGYVSLLYSIADKPLDLWSKHVSLGGKVRRIKDDTLHGDRVIEITGSHDGALLTNIAVPVKTLDALNIKLPILVLIVKNLNLRFKFDVQITDENQYRRRFSFMTYNLEKLPSIGTNMARVPLKLEEDWNSLEIDLQALCREAYGADYQALQRLIIYPNCYLRRVYLQNRHYNHDEIPVDMYQAFLHMYMSKWRIHFIDRACQTEECCGELPQRSQLNCSIQNDMISTSIPRKAHLFKNAYSMGKLENVNLSNTTANVNKSNVLKRHYMSLDTLKVHDEQNIIKTQSRCFTGYLITDTIAEDKIKDNNNNNNKQEIQSTVGTYRTENKRAKNVKNINKAVSMRLERIAKSQFLKTHVSEMLFRNNKSPVQSHLHRFEYAGDIHSKSVQEQNNIHGLHECKIIGPKFPVASVFNLSKNMF